MLILDHEAENLHGLGQGLGLFVGAVGGGQGFEDG
jgi:hypothetical protein